MKHPFVAILLFLALGSLSARSDGTITRIYQTTEDALLRKLSGALVGKDVSLISGDIAWAAYFAGREAVLREQLDELNSAPVLLLQPHQQ